MHPGAKPALGRPLQHQLAAVPACDIARELSIPVVVVPPAPGLTSALGLLTSDIAYNFSTTQIQSLARPDLARIASLASSIPDLRIEAVEGALRVQVPFLNTLLEFRG